MKNILVYIETDEGKIRKSGLELLTYACTLKNNTKGTVTALTLSKANEEALACMAKYGADNIILMKDIQNSNPGISDNAETIRQAAEKENAGIVLFAGSVAGKAIAPVVSAKLRAGMIPGIYSLPKNYNPFMINKKVFSGKAIATVTVRTPVKVLILLPNSFGIKENPVPLNVSEFIPGNHETTSSPNKILGIRVVGTIKSNEQVKLSEAGIVVSGGRGLSNKQNWRYVEEMAELLGGATACSRPAWDAGWCPHDGYVGQTGKVISPGIYLALGISGAVQHLAGINSPGMIVAVNKDPEAPIFKSADYGIVGDIEDVMPKLIEAVKNYRIQPAGHQKKIIPKSTDATA